MYTVTFIPLDVGYNLAMNRDERLTRIAGLPPRPRFIDGRTVLCPSEPDGGTWISLNDAHVCFALINWYSVPAEVGTNTVSRGEVVVAASPSCTSGEAEKRIAGLGLNFIKPFRLIGIFPENREVVEWRWDLKTLLRHNGQWESQQWISSGYDEPQAQLVRGATFENMRGRLAGDSLSWLRQLHSSHVPEPGPFSICMHREDAATVSYCEIQTSRNEGIMRYSAGTPCQNLSAGIFQSGAKASTSGQIVKFARAA